MEIVILDVSRYSNSIRNWWVSMALGVIYAIVGILVFFRTADTYASLSSLFGYMVILSGLGEIFLGVNTPRQSGKGMLIAAGGIEFLLGMLLALTTTPFAVYLPYILGFWIMFRGFVAISTASDMMAYGIKGAGLTLTLAILVVLCSFVILALPFVPALGSVVTWLGIALVLAGAALIVHAVHLNRLKKYLTV